MGYRELVAVEMGSHDRGAHTLILRLRSGGFENGKIGAMYRIDHQLLKLPGTLVEQIGPLGSQPGYALFQALPENRGGNAARHFTGAVSSHAVGKDGDAMRRTQRDSVLVPGTHPAGVRP
jgi:hypothetical protein